MKTLREINVFMSVTHVPMVSPQARDLPLHGFPETLTIHRKLIALGQPAQIKVVAVARDTVGNPYEHVRGHPVRCTLLCHSLLRA